MPMWLVILISGGVSWVLCSCWAIFSSKRQEREVLSIIEDFGKQCQRREEELRRRLCPSCREGVLKEEKV